MPPVIMKSVMHYSITYALHMHYIHFWKTPRKNEDDTQEYAVVKIDIAVILRREKKALGGNVSPPNKELTILLVIGVAGRFQLLCGGLRFFYFTFICQLQRVVNLTDQNVETVAEVFHFRAVR